jgi:hypothetical protein
LGGGDKRGVKRLMVKGMMRRGKREWKGRKGTLRGGGGGGVEGAYGNRRGRECDERRKGQKHKMFFRPIPDPIQDGKLNSEIF